VISGVIHCRLQTHQQALQFVFVIGCFYDDEIKQFAVGRVCSLYGRNEISIQIFVRKT
jgi:hypothetical protein